MADEHHEGKPPVIIIKRVIKKHNKHHGGAWKIAYADFVTAMMSFFLLMWLLSLLNKYQLEGIAQYFKKPLKEVFHKQDEIAPLDTTSPDMLGKTADINRGSKEKNKYSGGNNQEIEQKSKKMGGENQEFDQKLKKSGAANQANEKSLNVKPETAMQQMQNIKNQLEADLSKNTELSQYKNSLNFIVTSDGLKIQIKDLQNKPMFSEGGTDFQKFGKDVLDWLASEVNKYPNQVVILGHTDSVPFNGDENYSNWELSADRANATRRELINSGMAEDKIMRIMGVADKQLLNKNDSLDPSNRRIEIIILTNDAAKRMQEQ